MINANITNHIDTHIGSFPINITFAQPVTNFTSADITLTAQNGNGLTAITHTLTGTGATYILSVNVPPNVEGAFTLAITGTVNINGTPHNVIATPRTFRYDTVFNVPTTFGEPQHNTDTPQIVLPIRFGENVLWFDKSDLHIQHLAGAPAHHIHYYVRGQNANYEAVFTPATDTWGAITVDITGEVAKEANLVREIVNTHPTLITYNTLNPTLANIGTPYKTADDWWNIPITFTHPVIGFGIHTLITGIDHQQAFIYRGTALDAQPTAPPPPFSEDYDYGQAQRQHCVGDWISVDLQSEEQARYFWVKLQSTSPHTPEIRIK